MGERILARLHVGEEIIGQLKAIARETAIGGAAVTGLGAVREATLALYDPAARRYIETRLEEDLEIASMVGNISWVGDDPIAHMHGVLSRADCTTAAGHIMRAVVSVTVEVMMTVYPERVVRAPDESVGLNLLSLRRTPEAP